MLPEINYFLSFFYLLTKPLTSASFWAFITYTVLCLLYLMFFYHLYIYLSKYYIKFFSGFWVWLALYEDFPLTLLYNMSRRFGPQFGFQMGAVAYDFEKLIENSWVHFIRSHLKNLFTYSKHIAVCKLSR